MYSEVLSESLVWENQLSRLKRKTNPKSVSLFLLWKAYQFCMSGSRNVMRLAKDEELDRALYTSVVCTTKQHALACLSVADSACVKKRSN